MENASKALIIAGAIILSIVIIGLGMYFVNSASTVKDSVNMSEYDVTQFNAKFETYEGQRVKGSTVKTLVDKVRNNNNTVGSDDEAKQVKISYNGKSAGRDGTDDYTTDIKNKITNGNNYTVELTYGGASGMISEIEIKDNP